MDEAKVNKILAALASAKDFDAPPPPDPNLELPLPNWFQIMVIENEGFATRMCAVHAWTKQTLTSGAFLGGDIERDKMITRLVEIMSEAGWSHLANQVITLSWPNAADVAGASRSIGEGLTREEKRRMKQALRPYGKK